MTDQISFDGRVVIVTGAGGGLGRDYALELARRGARVVVNDVGADVDGTGRSEKAADAVVEEIVSAGGEAVASHHSVAEADSGAAIVETAVERFGTVDVVISNAGILRDRSFANLTPEELYAVLDVHLRGAFHVAQPAFRIMKENGYGRLVFASSNAGILGNFGQSNYGAAKMGLVGLSNVLAIEGGKYGIRSNVIAPVARTRMTEDLLGPLANAVDPRLVVPMVMYLASESCALTREIFSAGAGRYARFFIGATPGWFTREQASAEDIAEHMDQIRSVDVYQILGSAGEELQLLAGLLQEEGS
jgi:NAD(P)-dependent dehydrogenase (short-subunit alcohol dehydrogenase family)